MDSSKNKSSVTLSEQLLWHRGVVIALQLLFQQSGIDPRLGALGSHDSEDA